jgi:hypothetical protein
MHDYGTFFALVRALLRVESVVRDVVETQERLVRVLHDQVLPVLQEILCCGSEFIQRIRINTQIFTIKN